MAFLLPSGSVFGKNQKGFLNFNNPNILNGGLTSSFSGGDDSYDWGWGDYPIGTKSSTPDKIFQNFATAKQTNNSFWGKALMAFAVYGPNFISALKNRNPNINENDVLTGKDNVKKLLQSILNRTGGSLNPNDIMENTENREANILGIKTSYFVLGGFGLLAYKLFKDDFRTSNKNKNK